MSEQEIKDCNEKILCFVQKAKLRIKKIKENCNKRDCKDKKSA